MKMSLHLDLHQGCCFQVNSSNWGLGWCGDRILVQKMSPWILFGAATQVECAGLSTVLVGRFQPHLMPQCGRINTIIIMLTKSMNKTSHEY